MKSKIISLPRIVGLMNKLGRVSPTGSNCVTITSTIDQVLINLKLPDYVFHVEVDSELIIRTKFSRSEGLMEFDKEPNEDGIINSIITTDEVLVVFNTDLYSDWMTTIKKEFSLTYNVGTIPIRSKSTT